MKLFRKAFSNIEQKALNVQIYYFSLSLIIIGDTEQLTELR